MKDLVFNVPLSELLPDQFFKNNTPYSSFKELLESGGFHAETREDVEAIPESDIDAHVAATTNFGSWNELMQAALQQFFAKQFNN